MGITNNCPCIVSFDPTEDDPDPNVQVCYTWNTPILRVTIDALTNTATVEDESGVIKTFDRFIDARARRPEYSDIYHINVPFREEVDGFYLTSIESGPWIGELAANQISFEYCLVDGNGSCTGNDSDLDPWLVKSITASGETERSVSFEYETYVINDPTLFPNQINVLDFINVPTFPDLATNPDILYPTIMIDFDYTTVWPEYWAGEPELRQGGAILNVDNSRF